MTALIELAGKAKTRQLIFEAKGGILTDEESKTLDQYLTFSAKLCIGIVDGKLVCAWGLVPPSLMSDRAYLWLFSTEAVEEHKFIFVRNSQKAVAEMLEEYPIITGYCELGNTRSMRWLRWLGAVFGEPINSKAIPFEIRKRNG
jgi:hypothetical protein